jgi:hypothetical protein
VLHIVNHRNDNKLEDGRKISLKSVSKTYLRVFPPIYSKMQDRAMMENLKEESKDERLRAHNSNVLTHTGHSNWRLSLIRGDLQSRCKVQSDCLIEELTQSLVDLESAVCLVAVMATQFPTSTLQGNLGRAHVPGRTGSFGFSGVNGLAARVPLGLKAT